MSPSTQRTLYRFLAVFLASGAGDAIVQFAVSNSYDYRHLIGVLVAAAVLAVEKILSEHNDEIAAPTVNGVTAAIQTNAATVPPPTVAVPEAHVLSSPPTTPPAT